jgi:hypothetical protein
MLRAKSYSDSPRDCTLPLRSKVVHIDDRSDRLRELD